MLTQERRLVRGLGGYGRLYEVMVDKRTDTVVDVITPCGVDAHLMQIWLIAGAARYEH